MLKSLHTALAAAAGVGTIIATVVAGAGPAATSFATAVPPACTPSSAVVSAGVVTLTFGPDVGDCLWTVPNGVTQVTMTVNGAQGGVGYNAAAGKLGEQASAAVGASGGDTYIFEVGSQGGSAPLNEDTSGGAFTGGAGARGYGTNLSGGGGGGASFVWQGSDANVANDLIFLVGAGGGGRASSFLAQTQGGGGGGGGYDPTPGSTHKMTGAAGSIFGGDGATGTSFAVGAPGVAPAGDGSIIVSFTQVTTTITLTSNANPTTYGESFSLTAYVAAKPSEGRVEFRWSNDGGGSSSDIINCASVTPDTTTGGATCTAVIADLHAGGSNVFQAFYDDNGTNLAYADSTSNTVAQTVNKANTVVDLKVQSPAGTDATSVVFGQPITLVASVKADYPGSVHPGADPDTAKIGTVAFSVNGVPVTGCTAQPISAVTNEATCALPNDGSIEAGSLPDFKADYSGSADFNAQTDSWLDYEVDPADTTTAVTSSPNPSIYGEPFTIIATVTANSPATIDPLQDWVHFQIDGQPVECQETWDSNANLSSGVNGSTATCTVYEYNTLEALHVGNHTVEAIYVPSSDYKSSTGTMTQVVNPASTTTTASAAYYDWAPVPTVAITATVTINPPSILSFSPGVGLSEVFRGNVSFFNGSTLLCTVPLDEWGQALCVSAINPATVSPHSLTAIYDYDGLALDFLSSQSTTDVTPSHPQPTLVSVSTVFPNNGQAWLLKGAGFWGASSVTVCGISVPFTVVNDYTVLLGVPIVNGPQQCTITLTATGGTGSLPGTVTVVPQPQPGAPVVVYPTGPGTPATPACGTTVNITLSGLWTLSAWPGASGTSVADALSGGDCGNDITSKVAVVWGLDAATQKYHAYFPDATNVPGANDLATLTQGLGYWIGLNDPSTPVTWTIETA